jgi:hypothetical protein
LTFIRDFREVAASAAALARNYTEVARSAAAQGRNYTEVARSGALQQRDFREVADGGFHGLGDNADRMANNFRVGASHASGWTRVSCRGTLGYETDTLCDFVAEYFRIEAVLQRGRNLSVMVDIHHGRSFAVEVCSYECRLRSM